MKSFRLFLCSLLLVFALVGVASAESFTLSDYSVALNASDPGLVVNYGNVLTTPKTFDLALGQSSSWVPLFDIWTDETWVNNDDKIPQTITVSLSFSEPPPAFGGDVVGVTYGLRGVIHEGVVRWDGPQAINFGANGDGVLIAQLSDATFNKGVLGLWGGECLGAKVNLKLTYEKAAVAVPEPGMVIFLGAGLVGLLTAGRKRALK